MFILPLSEGLYRLALVALDKCRRNALELLLWSRAQRDTITAALADSSLPFSQYVMDELHACCNVMAWSEVAYGQLNTAVLSLSQLSQAPWAPLASLLPPLPGGAVGRAVGALLTPEGMWSAACLAYMTAATLALAPGHQHQDGPGARTGLVGCPELVVVCHVCALLLRCSYAPLAGFSGVFDGVYRAAALLLTAATTFIALAALIKVLGGGGAGGVRNDMCEVLSAVRGVAAWHRRLVLGDWLLALAAPLTLSNKIELSLSFALYHTTINMLQHSADTASAQAM